MNVSVLKKIRKAREMITERYFEMEMLNICH